MANEILEHTHDYCRLQQHKNNQAAAHFPFSSSWCFGG